MQTKTGYAIRDNDIISIDSQMEEYVIRVKDLPDNEKPREKLMKYGPESLTSVELLAVLLIAGTKKEEVLAMARRIFSEYGEKAIAFQKDPKALQDDFDLPITKACQIVASFELGRRFFQKSRIGQVTIRTSRQAFEYLKDIGNLPKEHLRGIYLNSHYKVIHDEVISVGSLTANIVHPREVFRPAIERNAAAILIAHNHPSGSTNPTQSDIIVTKQLAEAGKILGIELLDHLVIGKRKFFSIPIERA